MSFRYRQAIEDMMQRPSGVKVSPLAALCLDIFTGELETLGYFAKQLPPHCMLQCLRACLDRDMRVLKEELATMLEEHYNRPKKLYPRFAECLLNIYAMRFESSFYAENFPELNINQHKILRYEAAALVEQQLYYLIQVWERDLKKIEQEYPVKPLAALPHLHGASPIAIKCPPKDSRLVAADPSNSPSLKPGIPHHPRRKKKLPSAGPGLPPAEKTMQLTSIFLPPYCNPDPPPLRVTFAND